MKISRRALLASPALLLLPRRLLAQSDLADLVARVARARAPVRTLRGPFEQTRTIGLLATDVRSRGTLTLARPDRLRWELAPPDSVTFWVGPEGLAYRGAHGQGRLPASSSRIGGALNDLRTLLGDDLAKLEQRWDLRVARNDASGVDLEAIPRSRGTAGLQRIEFSLGPDFTRPKRVLLVEGPRDHTLIDFGELATNIPIDGALMRPP